MKFTLHLLGLLTCLTPFALAYEPPGDKTYLVTQIAADGMIISYFTKEYTLDSCCIRFQAILDDEENPLPTMVCGTFTVEDISDIGMTIITTKTTNK